MDSSSLLSAGGVGALLMGLAYVGKMFVDYRKTPSKLAVKDSAAVADAQTANAILMQSLSGLQIENARLIGRVQYLEKMDEAKDKKIDELEARLNAIATELATLKTDHHPHNL